MIFLEHWNNKVLHSENLGGTRMKAVSVHSVFQQSLKTFQNTPPHFAQETPSQVGNPGDCRAKKPVAPAAGSLSAPWDISVSPHTKRAGKPIAAFCQLNPCNLQQKLLQIFPGMLRALLQMGNLGSLTLMDSGCLSWFNPSHQFKYHTAIHPLPLSGGTGRRIREKS